MPHSNSGRAQMDLCWKHWQGNYMQAAKQTCQWIQQKTIPQENDKKVIHLDAVKIVYEYV